MAEPSLEHDQSGSALGPPRFSLRTLLLAMTAAGCLFGLMVAVGTFYSAVLALFALLVSVHVLGNSLGTRLRDRASRLPRESLPAASHPPVGSPRVEPRPPGRLTQRVRLHRITLVITALGAIGGGALGGWLFSEVYPEAAAPAVGLGVASFGVLGTFFGFGVSSFLSVGRQAWRESLKASEPAAQTSARQLRG